METVGEYVERLMDVIQTHVERLKYHNSDPLFEVTDFHFTKGEPATRGNPGSPDEVEVEDSDIMREICAVLADPNLKTAIEELNIEACEEGEKRFWQRSREI